MEDNIENSSDMADRLESSQSGHEVSLDPVEPREHAPSRAVKRSRVAGTLDAFVVRKSSADESTAQSPSIHLPEPEEVPMLPSMHRSLCLTRVLRGQCLLGNCTAVGRAGLQHHASSLYKEVVRWQGWPMTTVQHWTALQLNSSGDFLAAVMNYPDHDGCALAVQKVCSLRQGFANAPEDGQLLPPFVVRLKLGRSNRTRLAWNPRQQNMLYAISSAGYCIDGYDVTTCNVNPVSTYGNPEHMRGCGFSAAPRHLAIDFFRGQGPHVMATGTSKGTVALWDARAHKRPCSELQGPQHTGALQTLQVTPDGRAVIAGSQCGQVLMWDMRGGRSPTAQLGAYGPARHPLLAAVRLRAALAAVPGLTQQTHLPGTSLLSLILDALDPRRAAFCLPCGWQGVLDLVRQEVTHLYCPPHDEENPAALNHDCLPAWGRNGGPYCCPSASGVTLLDFNSKTASPCAVSGNPEEHAMLPSALHISTCDKPTALAVHPHTQEIIVATAGDNKLLLLDRMGT